jgi:hypothetical protein
VDFEVLVYTNTYADGEAAAGGTDAYLAAVAPLFERLRDPERQRAVINLDGAWSCCLPAGVIISLLELVASDVAKRLLVAGCWLLVAVTSGFLIV